MPVYEYYCKACDHEWEREQRISEDPIKSCPKCKARQARRMISRTSFVLKGGGWYSDLYSSPGAGKEAGGDAKAESSPAAESKSEKGETSAKPEKAEKSEKPAKADSKAKAKKDTKAA